MGGMTPYRLVMKIEAARFSETVVPPSWESENCTGSWGMGRVSGTDWG